MDDRKAIFIPGRHYHIFNHAIAWENFFKDAANYPYFLDRYAHHLGGLADLEAYCLMPNHYHLLVRIRTDCGDIIETDKKVLQAFGNFHNCYTKSINKRYNRKGRLFQSSLCRKIINDDQHLQVVIQYIRMNPVQHGFCSDPDQWPHTWIRKQAQAA